jgi:hypothetical protein
MVDVSLKFDKHVPLPDYALKRSRLIPKYSHSRDRLFLVEAFCMYMSVRCLNIIELFGLLIIIT